jgi:TonB family protein
VIPVRCGNAGTEKIMKSTVMLPLLCTVVWLSSCASPVEENLIRDPVVVEQQPRKLEDIRNVFDRNKNSIYAAYKALQKDPTLGGKILFRLGIEPDGSVSDCGVIESTLANKELEAELVRIVSSFRFGVAQPAKKVTIKYPIDFVSQ